MDPTQSSAFPRRQELDEAALAWQSWHDDLMSRSWVYRHAIPFVFSCIATIALSIWAGAFWRPGGKQLHDIWGGNALVLVMGVALAAAASACFVTLRLGRCSVLRASLGISIFALPFLPLVIVGISRLFT